MQKEKVAKIEKEHQQKLLNETEELYSFDPFIDLEGRKSKSLLKFVPEKIKPNLNLPREKPSIKKNLVK
jgi:hypothetical protein